MKRDHDFIASIISKIKNANADDKLTCKKELIDTLRPLTQIMADRFLPLNPTFEDIDILFEALENMPHPDLNAFDLDIPNFTTSNTLYILDKIAKNNTLLSLDLLGLMNSDEEFSTHLTQMLKTNHKLHYLRFNLRFEDGMLPFPAEKALLEGLSYNNTLHQVTLRSYSVEDSANFEKIALSKNLECSFCFYDKINLLDGKPAIMQFNSDHDESRLPVDQKPLKLDSPKSIILSQANNPTVPPAAALTPSLVQPKETVEPQRVEEPKPIILSEPTLPLQMASKQSESIIEPSVALPATPPKKKNFKIAIAFLAATVIATPLLFIAGIPIIVGSILLGSLALAALVSFGLSMRNKEPGNSGNPTINQINSEAPPQTAANNLNQSKLESSVTPVNYSVPAPANEEAPSQLAKPKLN